jgi:hypothetical protein
MYQKHMCGIARITRNSNKEFNEAKNIAKKKKITPFE